MYRHNKTRLRWGAWLALLALVLEALVPAVHRPAAAMAAQMADTANMCMAPIGPHGAPTDTDKLPARKSPPCPICQTLQMLSGGYLPPSAAGFLPDRAAHTVAHALPATSAPARRTAGGIQARGPPRMA